jgi:hypothetical protein
MIVSFFESTSTSALVFISSVVSADEFSSQCFPRDSWGEKGKKQSNLSFDPAAPCDPTPFYRMRMVD